MPCSGSRPSRRGVDRDRIAALVERAHREVDAGLLPSCQLALAREGELVCFVTIGAADDTGRYVVFSCTKAVVASAVWVLIGEGSLHPDWRVVDVIPEFAPNGKSAVTIEHLMVHTAGFPRAPMRFETGADAQARARQMASWRLDSEPGTRYEYHPTSAHWVLAELIERASGMDFREFVRERVTDAAGVPGLRLGGSLDQPQVVAHLQMVGEPPSPDELRAEFGVPKLDLGEVTDENVLRFNDPALRAIGVPGAGAVGTAADLALYYQALLHNRRGVWRPDVLADATGRVRTTLPDPVSGAPANRSLGLIIAGDDGIAHLRGFGTTNSPWAFGHPGAHGQVAWADPATGLSFAYLTNGLDRNMIRAARRRVALSSLAAVCAAR